MTNLTIHNSNKQQSLQKHKESFFSILIKQLVCNKKFNIEYLQLSRVDFIHFILMH